MRFSEATGNTVGLSLLLKSFFCHVSCHIGTLPGILLRLQAPAAQEISHHSRAMLGQLHTCAV